MQNELSLLYYSSNVIPEIIAEKIRWNLLMTTKDQYPIFSVTQKPIDFGTNICVGEIGVSKYNEYKQILIGLENIKTKYVACVEDDVLYSKEHFDFRPPEGFVGYDNNFWYLQENKDFYWRMADVEKRGGMFGCISETEHLWKNLTTRYSKFPDRDNLPPYFGEPAYHDEVFGMENKKVFFDNKFPSIVFTNHYSMGGVQIQRFHRRYGEPKPENRCESIEGFGSAKELISKYWDV